MDFAVSYVSMDDSNPLRYASGRRSRTVLSQTELELLPVIFTAVSSVARPLMSRTAGSWGH